MKKILVIGFLLSLVCSCGSKEIQYQKVSTDEAQEIMEKSSYQIIDVREDYEYQESHVVGSINIPYTEISTININKDTILFVYCKSGKRSKIAADTLLKMGYQVYDLGSLDMITLDKE